MHLQSNNALLVALHAGYIHSSLALPLLKAACFREPFYDRIHILETLANGNIHPVIEEIYRLNPLLIGFSTYLWNIENILEIAGIVKELLPESCIVLGGPEATPRAQEILKKFSFIDMVVEGEGETAFRELLRYIFLGSGSLETIPNLNWQHPERGILRNPKKTEILGKYASPFSLQLVSTKNKLVYFETSRGCPYHCTFCSSNDERVRLYPMERIKEDIGEVTLLNPRIVKVLDRSFQYARERTLQLLRLFSETSEGIIFHLEINPDRILPEAMAFFIHHAPTGKFQFEMGLQTTSEKTLQRIRRKMDFALAKSNIRTLLDTKKFHIHLDIIAGLPGETLDVCLNSLDEIFLLFPHHLQLGILKMLPGTPIRQSFETYGYIWNRRPPYEVLANNNLSFNELIRLKKIVELLERFWNNGLLHCTLRYLIPEQYSGKVSFFLNDFLQELGGNVWQRQFQIEEWFHMISQFLEKKGLWEDPHCREMFAWDYCSKLPPSKRTPIPLQEEISLEVISTETITKKLPVFRTDTVTIGILNQVFPEKLLPGNYALHLRKEIKGCPVQLISLGT